VDLTDFLKHGDEIFLPDLSVDLVIIGYEKGELKCLLLKVRDKWLLPGGYIRRDESVDSAAVRILRERTGLEAPHLKFLAVFGDKNRRFQKEWEELLKEHSLDWNQDYWVFDRFVSLTYYSLVHIESTKPRVSNFDEAFSWFSFDELPEMWMDHNEILSAARDRLKEDILKEPLTYKLLPDQFTMPELHQLHQLILQEQIDRSRFQKKMLSSGLFERLPKRRSNAPGRNPYQYRVKS